MRRYIVYGRTTVIITTEVEAESEEEAYEIADGQRCGLDVYVGNGGTDKLVGVDGENESVSADEEIVYYDIEVPESEYDDSDDSCLED